MAAGRAVRAAPPPPPPPPLTDATIRDAVRDALAAGGPEYAHPGHGPIAGWDVRNVTDMSGMFSNAASFDGDLSGWDVSATSRT